MGAKRKANKCRELWDNWQGWHTPNVIKLSPDDLDKANAGADSQVYVTVKGEIITLDTWCWFWKSEGYDCQNLPAVRKLRKEAAIVEEKILKDMIN